MAERAPKYELGSLQYFEAVQQEAAYWEGTASGEVDTSLAAWRDPALAEATTGDLLALDTVVARGRRVLEPACGGGSISMRLARRGCVCDGVDIAPGLVELARRVANELAVEEHWPGSARFFEGDLNIMTFTPQSYDVVLANAALHHVQELDHLLDALYAALRPGGTLICLDHIEPSRIGLLLRYVLLLLLPTEVSYLKKPRHIYNRAMARVYRRFRPGRPAPAAFALPASSPFEDVTGSEVVRKIRKRFVVERYDTHLLFADIVAGHLRLRTPARNIAMARRLRRLDDWLVRRLKLRGQTYYLVAHKNGDAGR
jgi:ubiquinone/menaquinone biosynthesis C-methylase UbiE